MMKKRGLIYIILVFLLLVSGSLVSCSTDRRTNSDSMADGQEKMSDSDTELIAPSLNYNYYNYSQVDEKYIYYIYGEEIRKYDRATGEEETIYQSEEARPRAMEKYQDYLYFIERVNGSGSYRLCSLSVDGKNVFLIDGDIISNDALRITDNYLFVRDFVLGDGNAEINDTIYKVEDGKGQKFEPDSINYEYESPDIYVNPESTEIQKNGEVLFRTKNNESVRMLTYNSKYVFARIFGEDAKILFYDLEQNTSEVYDWDWEIDIHVELHGDLAVFYVFEYPLEVKLVDLKEAIILK